MLLGRAKAGTVEALERDLKSGDARAKVAAAEVASSLIEVTGASSRAPVIAALVNTLANDPSADVRGACALALADVSAIEALPALLIAADDDSPTVRQLAITALGEIGDVRARERVRRALTDERPEVRFQAVVAFPRLCPDDDDDDAWAALAGGVDDEDALVRARAAEAVGELARGRPLPKPIANDLAIIVADEHDSFDARVAAAISLAESGDKRGAAILLSVMTGEIADPNPARVQAAFELAGELKLDGARDIADAAAFGLRARFGDPGRRMAALITLIRFRDRRAIDHVIEELGSRVFARRALAIGIAARTALAEARPHLERMRNSPTLADPETIDDALARIAEAAG